MAFRSIARLANPFVDRVCQNQIVGSMHLWNVRLPINGVIFAYVIVSANATRKPHSLNVMSINQTNKEKGAFLKSLTP